MTKIETLNILQKSKSAQLLNNLEQQAETLQTQSFQSVEQMAQALQPLALAMSQLATSLAASSRTLEVEMANGSVKIGLMNQIASEFNERQQASQLNSNLIWAATTLVTSVLLTSLVIWLTPPPLQPMINVKALAQQINQQQAQTQQHKSRK